MDSVCLGLRLYVPFWCSFRDPVTSNVHRTFPVPPPTTLYGLIAAALGLAQDDQSRRDDMRFGIALEDCGELVETYSKWMKAAEDPLGKATAANRAQIEAGLQSMRSRGQLTPDSAVWISSPIVRQKLVKPIFYVGILCSQETANEITQAIRRPSFPLYLGESDDVIDIEILGTEKPASSSAPATGVVSGVRPNGILANLPLRFATAARGKWELSRWLVTVPRPGTPIVVENEALVACHSHTFAFEPTLLDGDKANSTYTQGVLQI